MKKTAFLFPGQGSQSVGMGADWVSHSPAAREAFEEADAVLGSPLSKLCWEGPESTLQLTANTQPAILATSVAILRAATDEGLSADIMAGHSLGEYSALVAAGSLSFADALTLVRRRGELMQEAVPVGIGAMAAIIGLAAAEVGAVVSEAAQGQICSIANLNSSNQIVIAGHKEAVDRAVDLAGEAGARRAVVLPVSAPFHSPLMAPAREGLTPFLRAVEFSPLSVPVVTNIDAQPITLGDDAREALIRQVDGPVRWSESTEWMAQEAGVELFVEIGPGTVLTGLARRGLPETRALSLSQPSGLEKLRSILEGGE
ncbi:MAG: ACP S-malonyltransferase [Acidobacteriota bacterium]